MRIHPLLNNPRMLIWNRLIILDPDDTSKAMLYPKFVPKSLLLALRLVSKVKPALNYILILSGIDLGT